MLGIAHNVYMVILVFIIMWLHRCVKRGKIDFNKFLKYAFSIIILLDPIYWVWEKYTYGYLDYANTLPLYICSLFPMLIPIVAFSKKRGLIYRTAISCIATICYYGGFFGLIFNYHLEDFPFFHFRPQLSLFYHGIMFVTITLIWSTGYYKPRKVDRFLFMIPLLLLMIPSYIVDMKYGYNYCYFNGGRGGVLEYFSDMLGIPLFLIVLYSLLFWLIFIALTVVQKIESKVGKKNELSS